MANYRLNLQRYEVCSVYSYVTSAPSLFFQRIKNSVSQNFCLNANFIVGLTYLYSTGFATCQIRYVKVRSYKSLLGSLLIGKVQNLHRRRSKRKRTRNSVKYSFIVGFRKYVKRFVGGNIYHGTYRTSSEMELAFKQDLHV